MNRPRTIVAALLGLVALACVAAAIVLFAAAPPEKNPVDKILDRWRRESEPLGARFRFLVDELAKPGNEPFLREALKKEKQEYGLSAVVEAIRKLDDRRAAPDLIARFKTFLTTREGSLAGQNMAALLADWKVDAAVEPLLDNPNYYFIHGSEPPLARMGPAAIRRIAAVAGSEQDPRRDWAASLLTTVRDPEARPALLEAVKGGRADLRRSAAAALGNYPGADVEAALAEAADDADPRVAEVAIAGLLSLDAPRHRLRVLPLLWSDREAPVQFGCELSAEHRLVENVPALEGLLDHDLEPVRFAAIRALDALGRGPMTARRDADAWQVSLGGRAFTFKDPDVAWELRRAAGGHR